MSLYLKIKSLKNEQNRDNNNVFKMNNSQGIFKIFYLVFKFAKISIKIYECVLYSFLKINNWLLKNEFVIRKGYVFIFLLFIFLLFKNNSYSQVNLCKIPGNLLTIKESNLLTSCLVKGEFDNIDLIYKNDGYYFVHSCFKSSKNLLPYTLISLRQNSNLFYSIFYAPNTDEDGYIQDNYAYVGFIKKEYGESDYFCIKVKKTRIYTNNNIYTESIILDNGIILTIENKLTIKKIRLPEGNEINIRTYYSQDCKE